MWLTLDLGLREQKHLRNRPWGKPVPEPSSGQREPQNSTSYRTPPLKLACPLLRYWSHPQALSSHRSSSTDCLLATAGFTVDVSSGSVLRDELMPPPQLVLWH